MICAYSFYFIQGGEPMKITHTCRQCGKRHQTVKVDGRLVNQFCNHRCEVVFRNITATNHYRRTGNHIEI